jgi:2-polyprenyl-6-methoxyphenol hydroxylase-like FAD-dependent oxidoreductase
MNDYDAIVVGARCGGSTTAMLLARQGHSVLLVDRATFPSDTLSTNVIHARGIALLDKWGLLDRLLASGCPAMTHYRFDFGPVVIDGTTKPVEGHIDAYAPRRFVLDEILVDGARAAGAEVREAFNMDALIIEDGVVRGIVGHSGDGEPVEFRARIVIGADGKNSHVARLAGATTYHEKPKLQYAYYTYFRDLPTDGMQAYIQPFRGFGVMPSNDGLTLVVVGWPYAEATAYKADVEGNFFATLEMVPEFAERVRGATRVEPFLGGAVPHFFRTPYGPGWALVGDAGVTRDPITAQGISCAFEDSERVSAAVDAWIRGSATYDEAMGAWHRERDAACLPMYEFTAQMAALEPPPAEMQQLLGAIQGNQEAMDQFVSVNAGTISPEAFFAPDNLGALLGGGERQGAAVAS